MPTFINQDTGFPDETPCPGCGWPLYACLCPEEMDDEDEVEGQMILTLSMPEQAMIKLKELYEAKDPELMAVFAEYKIAEVEFDVVDEEQI